MIIADLHNDTPYNLFYQKQSLKKNTLHIDLTKQVFSKNLLFYAIYMEREKYGSNMKKYFFDIYTNFKNEVEKNSNKIEFFKDSKTFLNGKKHNAVLALEGGELIEDISDIDYLDGFGVKYVTLTWNYSNALACSHTDKNDKGLTDFGREIIAKMEEKNIFPDLSHASDKTFFDTVKLAKNPIMVTHSNSRALCKNSRNITDEMFLALKENGGILGINFYSEFLGKKSIFEHIEHFLKLGGENNIAFGSDFDGMSSLPDGITDFSSYKNLCELLIRKFSKETAEKIMYKNVIKILSKKRACCSDY